MKNAIVSSIVMIILLCGSQKLTQPRVLDELEDSVSVVPADSKYILSSGFDLRSPGRSNVLHNIQTAQDLAICADYFKRRPLSDFKKQSTVIESYANWLKTIKKMHMYAHKVKQKKSVKSIMTYGNKIREYNEDVLHWISQKEFEYPHLNKILYAKIAEGDDEITDALRVLRDIETAQQNFMVQLMQQLKSMQQETGLSEQEIIEHNLQAAGFAYPQSQEHVSEEFRKAQAFGMLAEHLFSRKSF